MANGGVDRFEDRPVIEQFLSTHNPDICGAETAIEVKTLVRRDFPLDYYGAHRPFHDEGKSSPRWTDGSGRSVPPPFRRCANKRRIRAYPARGSREFATLNHYALRSLESYLVKNERGDVNRINRKFDDAYWSARNDPAYRDDSILRHVTPLRIEMARLMALAGVAVRHRSAVSLHRNRCDALLDDPEYRNLQTRLRSTPLYGDAENAIRVELGQMEPGLT